MYTRNKTIYTKKIKNKWYILEKDKTTVRELNEVASFLWGLLVNTCTLEQLVDAVCKEYQVQTGVAKKDIQKFISEYVKKGYIETTTR